MTSKKSLGYILIVTLILVFCATLGLAFVMPLVKSSSDNDNSLNIGSSDNLHNANYGNGGVGSVGEIITSTNAPANSVLISDAKGILDFLTSTDPLHTYGYIDGTITEPIIFSSALSSSAILDTGRTLDGNGRTLVLATQATGWANLKPSAVDNRGGLLVARNKGTIKNFNFVFETSTTTTLEGDGYYGFGIVVGSNDTGAMLQNCNMEYNAQFSIHLNTGTPGASVNNRTISVGGFVGINQGAIDKVSINYAANSIIDVVAKGYGKYWGSKKANARASVGGIAGMQYGTGSSISNVSIYGTGTISSDVSQSDGPRGDLKNHAGMIIGGNTNGSTGQSGVDYGVKKSIIAGFAGNMKALDRGGNDIGLFSDTAADSVSNIVVLSNTTGTICNMGADTIPYNTLYKTNDISGDIVLSFSETVENQLDIQIDTVDSVNDNIFSVVNGEETVVSINDGLVSKSYAIDCARAIKNNVAIAFGKTINVSNTYADNTDCAYTDKDLVPFKYSTKDGNDYVLNNDGIVKIDITKDGVTATSSTTIGSYVFKILESTTNTGYIAFDLSEGIAILYTEMISSINVVKADINLVVEDTWKTSYEANVTVDNLIAGGIDRIEYSTDGGIKWNSVEGQLFNVSSDTIASGRVYKLRGYKNNELVTNEKEVVVKIDNAKPILSNVTSTVESGQWTNSDITIIFDAKDALSGIKNVSVNGTVLVGLEGKYSHVITESGVNIIKVIDNAGNEITSEYLAKIDKLAPSISDISATNLEGIYIAGTSSASAISFTGTVSIGTSGQTLQYSDDNGSTWIDVVVDEVTGSFTLICGENTLGSDLSFKLTNGVGIIANKDFGTFIIDRIVTDVIITNENISIVGEVNKIYDGTTDFNGEISLIGLGSAGVESEITATAKYNTANVGLENYLVFTIVAKGANLYNITNNVTNFSADITAKSVTVEKQLSTRVYGETSPAIEVVFNGLLASDKIAYTLSGAPIVSDNVGVYPITMNHTENSNYSISVGSDPSANDLIVAEITVNAYGVSLKFNGYRGLKYNGNAHNVSAIYVDVNGAEKSADLLFFDNANVAVSSIMNPSAYIAKASIIDTNYSIIGTNEISFNVALGDIIITAPEKTVAYNGDIHAIDYAINVEELFGELIVTYDGQSVNPSSAGRHTVNILFAGNDKYAQSRMATILIITSIDMNVALESNTFIFDKLPHTLELVGAPEGATVDYLNGNASKINVGVYNIIARVSADNYTTTVVNAVLTINKAVIEGMLLNDLEVDYDGNKHSLQVSGAPDSAIITYYGNGIVNAGKYDVIATIEHANYISIELVAILNIKHSDITGVTVASVEHIYNNMPVFISAKGVPEGAEIMYLNNGVSRAGYHTVTTIVNMENCNRLEIKSSIFISRARVNVNFDIANKYWVGDEIDITAYVTDINGNKLVLDVVFNKDTINTKSGEYECTAVIKNNNYELIENVITFNVYEHVPVGAIVGGVLGGLAVLLAGAGVAWYLIKKHNKLSIS